MHVSIFHFADVEGNFDKWKSLDLLLLSFLRVDLPPQDRGIMVHVFFFFFLFIVFKHEKKRCFETSKIASFELLFGDFFFLVNCHTSMVFRQDYDGDININSLYYCL